MTARAPLEGFRVLDLSRILAGPWCAMMLGDLGADVVKVERPGAGDDTRAWGPPFDADGESAYYLCANRNKRSIALNLESAEDRAVVERLVARADVLVENFRPGTLERFGLGNARLRELRPDLIHASISAFGATGPHASEPGYDFLLQARGGLMSITGPPGDPHKVGVAVCDLFSAQNAVAAILAALVGRERGGGGRRLDVSLFDSQVAMLANVASGHLVSGAPARAWGNGHPNIVPYQAFVASDGPVAVGVGNDAQWRTFCAAVDREAWSAEHATNAERVEERAAVTERLDALFATRTRAEWFALLESLSIPCAPIQTVAEVFRDPRAAGLVVEVDGVPLVRSPILVDGAPLAIRRRPPRLDEHRAEILAELEPQ